MTCTPETGDDYCFNVCQDLWGDGKFLEQYASKYETTTMSFYLGLDKYTCLPTALGYEYVGEHTIEGQKFALSSQCYQAFNLASQDSYEAIMEEPIPDVEPESKATPLFYHVTGADGQEMWLFGTIHAGDNRTGFLPQEIYDAFAASDALALECDVDGFDEQLENDKELQEAVSKAYLYGNGSTAKEHIDDEETYEYGLKLLKATGNYHPNLAYMKAGLWGSSIENFYLDLGYQLLSSKGVDMRLTRLAHEQNKPIREIESNLFQIEMSTGFSDELQEFLLYSAISTGTIDYAEGVLELYELWCAGDEAALTAELTQDEPWEITESDFEMEGLTEEEIQEVQDILARKDEINAELAKIQAEYQDAMGFSRNAGMLEVAKEYLESGDVVFYAVGLAHLLAEDGLVNTLRDAGYTVELVTYAE